jgi:hypothetical protein
MNSDSLLLPFHQISKRIAKKLAYYETRINYSHKTTGHKDIVKTNFGIIKYKKQNEIRYITTC